MDTFLAAVTAIAALLTSFGIWIGVQQLKTTRRELDLIERNAQTSFEDDLSREYRLIIADLPTGAFYSSSHIDLQEDMRRTFFRYFDLSNEQLFLGRLGRVSGQTLSQWRDGIEGNLRLPLFSKAWQDIGAQIPPDFFEDLRLLLDDPPTTKQTHP